MTVAHDAGTAEIRLIDLEKRFGAVRAVDGVSLDVRAGEFFSLLGPSGCGKTTTLRMIGGFELPTGGRILLRDRDITTDPPDKRPVNMVFQHYALFPHLDVGENIAFGLRRKRVERAEIARRVAEALELVRLEGYDRRKPNQLSGGQQQRVALARALVNRPTRAAPRRAARRPRPQAPPPAPDRAQAHPVRGRHHVRVRHPRPGGGADDERPDRGHARRAGRAARHAGGAVRATGDHGSWPTSSARPTCCAGSSRRDGSIRLDVRGACPGRRTTASAPGATVEISIRPESIELVPAEAEGAIRGQVEQAAYLGTNRQLPGPHGGRPGPVRPGTEDRGPPPGRQRGGRDLAAVRGARPRRRARQRSVR